MPPKTKNNTSNNRISKQSSKKKTHPNKKVHDDDDDALLDQLIAQNSATATTKEGSNNISAEDEERRLKEAKMLQNKAKPHVESLAVKNTPPDSTKEEICRHRIDQATAYSSACDLYVHAMFALAGVKDRKKEELMGLPAVFTSCDEATAANILTPKLREAAENILLTILSWSVPQLHSKHNDFLLQVAETLVKLAPHSAKGWQQLVHLNRSLGRYAAAIEVLEQCMVKVENEVAGFVGADVENYLKQIKRMQKEMSHVDGQLGETELLCPICLSDCMLPRRARNCPHIACNNCWEKVFRESHEALCPVCRAPTSCASVPMSSAIAHRYYLQRLDRDQEDAIAWFHLANYCNTAEEDPQSKAYQLYNKKKASLPSDLDIPAGFFALEALRCSWACPQYCEEQQGVIWDKMTSLIFDLNEFLSLEDRRRVIYDLGPDIGKQTLLTAAIYAYEAKRTDNKCQFILRVACRDFAAQIENGIFRVLLHGKKHSAIDLCKDSLLAKADTLVRLLYVMYLTRTMDRSYNVRFSAKEQEDPEPINATTIYIMVLELYKPSLRIEEYMYLAIGWRRLSLQQRNRLALQTNQEALWGGAVKQCVAARDFEAVADAMGEDEKALVGMTMLDREAVRALQR